MLRTFAEVERLTVIPKEEKWTRVSMTLPDTLLERLEEVRERVNKDRAKPVKLNRDKVTVYLLTWALDQYDAQEKSGSAKPRRS